MQKMADPGYSSQTVSSTNLDAVEQSQSQYRSDEEDEDEKVLEVSKNKRWNKMAVQVSLFLLCSGPLSSVVPTCEGRLINL